MEHKSPCFMRIEFHPISLFAGVFEHVSLFYCTKHRRAYRHMWVAEQSASSKWDDMQF